MPNPLSDQEEMRDLDADHGQDAVVDDDEDDMVVLAACCRTLPLRDVPLYQSFNIVQKGGGE